MITFTCPGCTGPLSAPDAAAGKTARCGRCGKVLPIPLPGPAGATPVTPEDEATFLPSTLLANVESPSQHQTVVADQHPQTPVAGRDCVAGYEILSELGRGGMGVVYMARQTKLNRLVALKMILSGGHASERERVRFRTEAEAVARLQHPNIVQVYEVGEHDGLPFLSLEFCPGGSLDRKLAGAPLPARQAASLLEKLALAIQAAHQANVLHRDLKPANVLLGADGKPKITDFGLAKKLDEDPASGGEQRAGPTQTGAVLGTPSYMAPEQARGDLKEMGPATDVYALGAILYELLTGRPPFKAAVPLDTIFQVVREEPASPCRLNAKVPADLETICLKCLQKDPGKRYASARALAEDLQRFLKGEPITARPVGRVERAGKWARRNPIPTAAAAVVGITVVTAFLLVMGSRNEAVRQADRAKRFADEMLQLARQEQAQRAQANLQTVQLMQQQGHGLCAQGESGQGLLWLARGLEQASRTQQTGLEGDLLRQANDLEHAIRLDLALCAREVHELRRMLSHRGSVRAVAFSLTGALAITGSSDGEVRVWDLVKGEPLGEPLQHPGEVRTVAVSVDGKTLLAAGGQPGRGQARLWNLVTRQPIGPPLESPCLVLSAALHPDGRTVVVGRQDARAQMWDGVAGQPIGDALAHAGPVRTVAFRQDGEYFATGCESGGARCWNTATRQPAGPPLRAGNISAVAFRPAGLTLLTGGEDQTARLWNPFSGTQLGAPLRHNGTINAVCFSPDGRLALVSDDDQTARLWDLATGLLRGVPLRHSGRVYATAFSPDGQSFLTGEEDGAARLWRLAAGVKVGRTLRTRAAVWAADYSPDGRTIAAGDAGGFVYLWDAVAGKLRRPPLTHGKWLRAVAFHPDNQRLLTGDGEVAGVVRQWRLSTGEETGPAVPSGPVKDLAWSPDGKRFLTAHWSCYGLWSGAPLGARRWDAASGAPLEPFLKHKGDVWAVRYSRDGKTILTGSGDRTVRLWDAATGKPLGAPLVHPVEVWSAVFSPDGALVLTGGRDRLVRVWDVATGRLVGKALPHLTEVRSVAFSPDGQRILTGSRDGYSRLWDFRTRSPLGPPLPQFGIVEKVAFAPDGQKFLTAGRNGTVCQWLTPQAVKGDARQVRDWAETITGLVLDPNEAIKTLSAEEWSRRRRTLLREAASLIENDKAAPPKQ